MTGSNDFIKVETEDNTRSSGMCHYRLLKLLASLAFTLIIGNCNARWGALC